MQPGAILGRVVVNIRGYVPALCVCVCVLIIKEYRTKAGQRGDALTHGTGTDASTRDLS